MRGHYGTSLLRSLEACSLYDGKSEPMNRERLKEQNIMNTHTVKDATRANVVPDEKTEIEKAYMRELERNDALSARQREQALEDLAEQEQMAAMDRQEALREQQIAEEEERVMESWTDRQ
jgi:ribosomal protein L14E/L6E/L27E